MLSRTQWVYIIFSTVNMARAVIGTSPPALRTGQKQLLLPSMDWFRHMQSPGHFFLGYRFDPLGPHTYKQVLAYLDNVVIISRTFSELLANLEMVLERFQTYDLKLKPRMCYFFSD